MRRALYSIVFLFIMSAWTYAVQAQVVSFKLSAPSDVVVGEQFRIVYTLNAEGRDFKEPAIDGFDVLMGPIVSSNMNMTVINGQSEIIKTNTYTYTLLAEKEGKFKIPSATVSSDGRKYSSNATTITVHPADKDKSNNNQSSQNVGKSGTDYFVKAILSSSSVYQQDKILLTYKLYSRYDFGVNNVKFPSFDGFFVQDIELPKERQLAVENVNGVNYRTVVLKQCLLYPQNTGQLTIPSAKVECVFRIKGQQRVRSIFDDFFETYQDVEKSLNTPASTIQVKELPSNKPTSFSGAVGDLSITSKISREKVKTNESVTVTVTISGNGNLKLVKEPDIKIPEDFETFDPKITNNFKPTAAGVAGSKVIEYVFVPRHKGSYTIPSTEYSYFNTKSQSYKIITLQGYTINVDGEGVASSGPVTNYSNQEAVKRLGEDILYIKSGDLGLTTKDTHWFGSLLYWLLLIVPVLIFILFVVLNQKRIKENQSIVLTKNKNANKVAVKRLKLAMSFLKENNDRAYYTEMEKALWGYLSDKLTIPVATLSKENVGSALIDRGASQDIVNEVFQIIDSCEIAIYSPMQKVNLKNELYDQAIRLIGQIENIVSSSNKKGKTVTVSAMLLFVLLFISPALAASPVDVGQLTEQAEKSYAQKNYDMAIGYYLQIEQLQLESALLYYNMGNTYFKNKQIGKSIQYYEKALLIDPNFSEAKNNLEIAQSRCVDKIEETPLLFFEQWILYVQNLVSSNSWAIYSIVCLVLFLSFSSLFLFGRTSRMKKISFSLVLLMLLLCIASISFAWSRNRLETSGNTAVIGVSNITMKSTPDDSGSNLFILHEGTKVRILNRIGDWVEVSSMDNNIAWLKEDALLQI